MSEQFLLINEGLVIQSDKYIALEPSFPARDLGIGIRLGIRTRLNLRIKHINQ